MRNASHQTENAVVELDPTAPRRPRAATAGTPTRGVRRETLADVQTKRMRWLSSELGIPSQGICVLAARGGSGKSLWAQHLAALVTRGDLPGDIHGQPRDVCLIAHEDPFDTIVVPRFQAAGGDLLRIHRLTTRHEAIGVTTVPRIPRDLPFIRAELIATGAKLLIIDPATAVLEGDNDKLGDVRMLVDSLAAVAEELDIVVMLIVHFRKGANGPASDRVSGSHAYRDAARTVFHLARDPESGTVVVSHDKGNYAPTASASFAFRLVSTSVRTDDGEVADVPRVHWLGPSERTVDDIERAASVGARYGDLRAAVLTFIAAADEPLELRAIGAQFPEAGDARLRQTLSRLTQSGQIERAGRGRYAAKPTTKEDIA